MAAPKGNKNAEKWDEDSYNIEVIAVELDPELAILYQERFPNDYYNLTILFY